MGTDNATITIIHTRPFNPGVGEQPTSYSKDTHGHPTQEVVFELTGGTDYPTNGYTVTAAALGLSLIHEIHQVREANVTPTGYTLRHNFADRNAASIKVEFDKAAATSAATAEVVDGSNVSGAGAIRLVARGK